MSDTTHVKIGRALKIRSGCAHVAGTDGNGSGLVNNPPGIITDVNRLLLRVDWPSGGRASERAPDA
jgi:hypothetical protein